VSWLRRMLGTADAVEDARERAVAEEDTAPETGASGTSTTTNNRPAGWGDVETSQDGDELVIALPAPGLDKDSIEFEPEGSSVKLHATGSNREGQQILLDETLKLPDGSDASQATVAYEGERLVVRIPKSALKPGG